MPAEGMVHALRRASELVAPRSVLLDLHPTPDIAELSIVSPDGSAAAIGVVHSATAAQRHANAEAAVASALADGFVGRGPSSMFVFSRYCDSIDELAAYLEAKWTAWLDRPTQDRARRELRSGHTLRVSERVTLTTLRPQP